MTRRPSEWGVVFDLDDTLLYTSPTFEAGVLRLSLFLQTLGLEDEEIRSRLLTIDLERINELGYGKARWPESMGLAYRSFVNDQKLPGYDPALERRCVEIGWETYEIHPELKPGAREVLEGLRPHARLVLATRGDEELQGRRIDHAGLRHHFDAMYFMEWKTPETYGALLQEQGFDPRKTFIIGDAIRSDINPALSLGAHAILVRGQNWEHERVDPLEGHFHEVDDLEEIPPIILRAMGVHAG